MARSLPADFFVPEVAEDHAFSRFTDKLYLMQQALAGVAGSPVDVLPPGDLSMKGERLVTPYFARISSLVTRRDLTSASAPTDLKLTGEEKGTVVLRRKAGPVAISDDVYRTSGATPAMVSAEIGKQIGEEMFKEIQGMLFTSLNAALGNTVGGVNHISDNYKPYAAGAAAFRAVRSSTTAVKETMTLGMINKGKTVLGDSMAELTTFIIRSEIAKDLIDNGIATGYDMIAGHAAVRGLPRTVGMGDPTVMDLSQMISANPSGSQTGSGSGTGTASLSLYRSYLLGAGVLKMIFPHELTLFDERRGDAEAPYTRILGNYDVAVGIQGMGWKSGSTANPTLAQLGTASNWEDKTTGGSREVKAIIIESNKYDDAAAA